MNQRTSETHPIRIDSIDLPSAGRIGMTFCPGKKDPHALQGVWHRDLDTDLRAIRQWGASQLVTLMQEHEFGLLQVPDLCRRARKWGMAWLHMPIVDVSIPGPAFEQTWSTHGADILSRLCSGESIALHCRGGLGRTGLVAARLLIELGFRPPDALRHVRTARPGTVETREQERYVLASRRVAFRPDRACGGVVVDGDGASSPETGSPGTIAGTGKP